jgi:putative flippase GtrA
VHLTCRRGAAGEQSIGKRRRVSGRGRWIRDQAIGEAEVQVLRYLMVGVVNTVIGLSIIFALMHLGVADVAANAAGYAIGLCVSFVLNGRWTFGAATLDAGRLLRFLLVVGVAYLANLAALVVARDALGWGSHLGQLAGAVTYTAVGFVGSRWFAFAARRLPGDQGA